MQRLKLTKTKIESTSVFSVAVLIIALGFGGGFLGVVSGCGYAVSTDVAEDKTAPTSPSDDESGGPSQPGPIVPSGCGTIALPEYPKFVSITSIYPDPSMLLTVLDMVVAEYRLKTIASPTTQYQAELTKVVVEAQSLDVAHLLLLLRASFFAREDFERVTNEIEATEGKTDHESCRRRAMATRDLQMMSLLQGESAMMLGFGVSKLAGDLSWEQAREVLQEAMPGGSLSPAFMSLTSRFRPLTIERVREAMLLADAKAASDAAGALAHEFFVMVGDKSFDALLVLASELGDSSRTALFRSALADFKSFSLGQMYSLIAASGEKAGEIVGLAVDRLEGFSHASVVQIASRLGDRARGEFLTRAVTRYEKLSMKEMKELIGATSHERGLIAVTGATKVADVNVADVVWIAGEISGEAKDKWIASTIEKLEQVSSGDVVRLMDETYYGAMKVAKALKSKISDLDIANVVLIASKLAGSSRDEWLELTAKEMTSLTTSELIMIMDAAYYGSFSLAKTLRPRLSDSSFHNLLMINTKLGGQNRDEWIKLFLPEFSSLDTKQVIEVMHAAYYAAEWVATDCLDRISDFDVDSVRAIGSEIGGQDRDKWLRKAIYRLGTLTSADVISLMTLSYNDAFGLALELLPRTSDFTVDNAVRMVEKISGQNRDKFLVKAIDAVIDLDESNLEKLVVEAHGAAEVIRVKGNKRLKKNRPRVTELEV